MARSFNGSSDLIAVDGAAHTALQTSAFSIAVWARATTHVTNVYLWGEGNAAGGNGLFEIGTDSTVNSKIRLVIRNTSNSVRLNYLSTATPFADTAWHLIIYAQDASQNVALYMDSTKETTSYTNSLTLNPDKATIGALVRASATAWWNGVIGSVATFNRQLTDGEAASLAAGLPASLLNPLHYWPMFGADSPEPDLGTGTHVTGTLTGTAFAAGHDPASLLSV